MTTTEASVPTPTPLDLARRYALVELFLVWDNPIPRPDGSP